MPEPPAARDVAFERREGTRPVLDDEERPRPRAPGYLGDGDE
jgi:hypothetical protein